MTPNPDGPFPWLAARADGELPPAVAPNLDAWTAANPDAAAALHTQESLAASNRGFWKAVEPPAPSEAAWASVRCSVGRRLDDLRLAEAEAVRRSRIATARLTRFAVAASVALAVGLGIWAGAGFSPNPVPSLRVPAADPLADFAVLPMADRDDVAVYSASGDATDRVLGSASPLWDGLILATSEDVRLDGFMPPTAPKPKMTSGPSDSPMIYAGRGRSP